MPRGKKTRGGSNRRRDNAKTIRQRDIHSRIAGLPSSHHAGHSHNVDHNKSVTAAAIEAAKYFQLAIDVEEQRETHVIPRQSLTRKLLLNAFPQQIETEARIARQLDKRAYNGKAKTVSEALQAGMIETSDQRLVYKSDRSLLRQGNPFKDAENGNRTGYKRDGTVSIGLDTRNYREAIPNADPVMETVIGPALDDDPFVEPIVELTDAEIAAALDDPS